MTVPIWTVVLVAVMIVLLVAWAIVAAFAWWGLALELEDVRNERHLMRIDIHDARTAAHRSERVPASERHLVRGEAAR